MKCRHKPIEFEYFRYGYDEIPEWFKRNAYIDDLHLVSCDVCPDRIALNTKDDDFIGMLDKGDYVVFTAHRELVPYSIVERLTIYSEEEFSKSHEIIGEDE